MAAKLESRRVQMKPASFLRENVLSQADVKPLGIGCKVLGRKGQMMRGVIQNDLHGGAGFAPLVAVKRGDQNQSMSAGLVFEIPALKKRTNLAGSVKTGVS